MFRGRSNCRWGPSFSRNTPTWTPLSCVIQGDTRHFDFVCQGVTQGVMQLQLQWNMPIAFGVLTTNDLQQALDRSGGRLGNKGDEAAAAAIQMVHLQDEMDTEENALDRKAIN